MCLRATIPILYNNIGEEASLDEIDVLAQVDAVSQTLEQLGFSVSKHPFPEDSLHILEDLKKTKPLLVFNLVEEVSGEGRLSYLVLSVLEALNIRYTGCSAEAIFLTTNKVTTKRILRDCGIPTPQWITEKDGDSFTSGERYIIKALYEDGSVDLHQDSVIRVESMEDMRKILKLKKAKIGKEFFAERFIEGREINVSILGQNGEPFILPPCEIKFNRYKDNNIDEILDYSAKWEEDSFQYKNMTTTSVFDKNDDELLKLVRDISKKCWQVFALKGYARVDYRIDKNGEPWVLEINANPCVTPVESSFIKAATQAGLTYKDVVKRIIAEAEIHIL